jgi:hypothetical protein
VKKCVVEALLRHARFLLVEVAGDPVVALTLPSEETEQGLARTEQAVSRIR